MASPDLRKLLLRVQTDADFYNLLLVDPQQALTEYSITPTEQEVLLRRDQSIFQFLVPTEVKAASADDDSDEDRDLDPDKVLELFPDLTTPQPPPTFHISMGGGFHFPPFHLPPVPPPIFLQGQPPPPPDPFAPIPPPPAPPLPDPPPPPDIPPPLPMFQNDSTIIVSQPIPILFGLADTDVINAPTSLISNIQQSSGEERAQAILQLLKLLDRRE